LEYVYKYGKLERGERKGIGQIDIAKCKHLHLTINIQLKRKMNENRKEV
jgi:hypothetical protein